MNILNRPNAALGRSGAGLYDDTQMLQPIEDYEKS